MTYGPPGSGAFALIAGTAPGQKGIGSMIWRPRVPSNRYRSTNLTIRVSWSNPAAFSAQTEAAYSLRCRSEGRSRSSAKRCHACATRLQSCKNGFPCPVTGLQPVRYSRIQASSSALGSCRLPSCQTRYMPSSRIVGGQVMVPADLRFQNSPYKRAAKIEIGPRSALSAGFIMN